MRCLSCIFFFFNNTATTEIYTLSLHDALPIYSLYRNIGGTVSCIHKQPSGSASCYYIRGVLLLLKRSEEHTSELQSQFHLVCRLLLEKKKINSILTKPYSVFARHWCTLLGAAT